MKNRKPGKNRPLPSSFLSKMSNLNLKRELFLCSLAAFAALPFLNVTLLSFAAFPSLGVHFSFGFLGPFGPVLRMQSDAFPNSETALPSSLVADTVWFLIANLRANLKSLSTLSNLRIHERGNFIIL